MEQFKVSDLQGHPRNPRKISDEQLTMLQKSLHEFGDLSGFVFNRKKGRLVGGHMRGRSMPEGQIAIEKRYETPTRTGTIAEGYVEIEGERHKYREVSWEEERETAAMIAANQHGGTWDFPTLAEHLVRMDEINLDPQLLGFTSAEIEDIMTYAPEQKEPGCPEDEVPSARAEPNIKRGEIYALGNHRLMCGDSTSAEDVAKLMNGEKADMVFTSPPYNVGIDYATHDDKMDPAAYRTMLGGVRQHLPLTDDAIIVWNKGVSIHPCDFRTDLEIIGGHYELNRVIAWTKTGVTGPPLIYHTKQRPFVKNYMPNFGWEILFVFGKKSVGSKNIPAELLNKRSSDVWECAQHAGSDGSHPAAFPVELASDAIQMYCDESVYEPFCGSGSTLIACEKTNRRCFGMEIDPVYCQVILDRYVKFTGKEPTQIK